MAWGGKLKYTISKNFINGLRANYTQSSNYSLAIKILMQQDVHVFHRGYDFNFLSLLRETVKFINEMYLQNVLNNEVKTIGDAW